MSNKQYSLDDLFSDHGPLDEPKVAEVLHPLVTIQKSTNTIFFKDQTLSVERRVLAYALAKMLMKSKGLIDSHMITGQEFYEATRIKKGTVDPTFKSLKDKGLLVGKGASEIPTHKLPEVLKLLGSTQ